MIFLSLRFLRSCQGKKDISFTFLRFREFLSTQRRPRLNHTLINDHYFIIHLKQSFDAIFNKMFLIGVQLCFHICSFIILSYWTLIELTLQMMRTSKKLKRKNTPSSTVKPHQGCPSAFVMRQTCL